MAKRLKEMAQDTATGLDGWSAKDLKVMQPQMWDMLAAILRLVEQTGVWPARLAEGFIALVPKGEGGDPLQLRPLSALSVIYRLWAGVRLDAWMTP